MIKTFIKTYGCQANVADSINLKNYLCGLGCQDSACEREAELIIINSCAIREKAEHKMCSYLGKILELKKKKPYLVVGVIGCVASYRKRDLMEKFPRLDFAFGAKDDLKFFKVYITDVIESIKTQKNLYFKNLQNYKPKKYREKDIVGLVKNRSFEPVKFFKKNKKINDEENFKRSMINIMRGCNNYCSYCIVPFTTGRERSFSMNEILDQIKRDVENGVKEITLLGQNVNSYKDPETGKSFEKLMEKAAQIDGDFWVRFVSPHPKDMTTDLIDVIAENDKLCTFIHLPLQSGSNKILKLMNRTYSIEKYMEKVEQIKKRIPGATLTTDIIVGFPREGESDYQATRKVVEEVFYNTIFSFVYSPRKFTKAALMKDSCPREIKSKRLKDLQNRQREIGTEVNKKLIGKVLRILVEEKNSEKLFWGRTEGNVKTFVNGDDLKVGTFVFAKITDAQQTDIRGEKVG